MAIFSEAISHVLHTLSNMVNLMQPLESAISIEELTLYSLRVCLTHKQRHT